MVKRYVFTFFRLANAALLVWALARHPIGYYTVLRVITTGVSLYSIYICMNEKRVGWGIIFAAIAVIFQPIYTLRMTRETWRYVDVITAVVLMISLRFVGRSDSGAS
jgi:uncharacterized protein DUF6804